MSSKSSRGAVRKRTHNLGGCSTCRRRHLKCDRTKPECTVCQKTGISCDGYPSQIRWASTATGPPTRRSAQSQGSRAESSKQSLPESSQLIEPVIHNADDFTATDASSDGLVHLSPEMQAAQQPGLQNEMIFTSDTDIFSYPSAGSLSDLESLFDSSGGLGWSDLFDSTMTFSMPAINDQTYDDPLGILAHVSSQPQMTGAELEPFGSFFVQGQSHQGLVTDSLSSGLDSQPPPYAPREISESEVMEYAKPLLKHFRDSVVPQFAPVPMNAKSPWEILNWNAAVQTHADLTYLQSPEIKHASKANFYAILGCSAHAITATQRFPDILSYDQGLLVLDYARRRAKDHMQKSLSTETAGSYKAKYKDQLMALFSLIALATLKGNSKDARCYLIDAERLMRVRGLAKREVSRRARLLHHVYTWLRIIGESTFTLHDNKSSGLQDKIEKMIKSHKSTSNATSAVSKQVATAEEHAQLDDFLRVETHGPDSDSDVDTSKDEATGLRDIHLSDLRSWSSTLYMEIYGIPEIWLSLVSQTTRVANILDLLDQTSLQAPKSFTNSVQRKTNKLEHVICSFSAQYSVHNPSERQDDGGRSGIATPRTPSAGHAMLRAMGSALLIFFYRRIRKVHPFILQNHVDDVIAALKDFDAAQGVVNIKTPGTPWPAFIAGCEAISSSSRDWLTTWLQQGSQLSAFNSFASSQQVMQEVWKKRDTMMTSSGKNGDQVTQSRRGEVLSWVDVLRNSKIWLMLY